jgi:magnesium-transporting ATPase (P-type)
MELVNIHDCIQVLFGKLAQSEARFLAVLVLARKFYSKSTVGEEQRFVEYVQVSEFPFESRRKALEMIVDNRQGSEDAALIFGASETNDQEQMMELMTLIAPL